MNYENQSCPGCGKPFEDGDDIVVCPVCATPQHRECWMENGKCANDELHASGYVWEKGNTAGHESAVEQENPDVRICHVCNSENPSDALHCGNCGALFEEQEKQEICSPKCIYCGNDNPEGSRHCNQCGAPLPGNTDYGGSVINPYIAGTRITADEKIGENTAEYLAYYVKTGAGNYVPKFQKFENGKKLSFNWAALLFAPYWFFYRKLYKAGFFALIVFVTASMLLSGYSNAVYDAYVEYSESVYSYNYMGATEEELAEIEDELAEETDEFYAKAKKPMLIIAAVNLILRLACALSADKIYYQKICKDMKVVRNADTEERIKKSMAAVKGGTSSIAFILSLVGENVLINILSYAADTVSGLLK